ncbi:hypothetical protein SIO70_23150 [Chitinophaga sancti]|uniref:hypothetical protein n=1 Tax=Chitinophaga sancti TaxID=1004 RepID=UPI002A75D701|nr:hypothetical protein [Chitinophaga sancti]WPQ61260.1 hypothetical protein SIO70_23150 [Chitinophaga sancti]
MEKLISDILSSIKYYFKFLKLFRKSEVGVYFLLFKDKSENLEVKKYSLLLLSFFFFYIIGWAASSSDFNINYDFVKNSYEVFIKDLSINSSYKDNFKMLLSLSLILEFTAFIFTKKKADRIMLSKFNFLLAAWTFVILSLFIMAGTLMISISRWLSLKESTQNAILGIIVLIAILPTLVLLFSPFLALSVAKERRLVSEGFESKGFFLNILIPILVFILMKGIFGSKSVEDDVYFSNGNRDKITLKVTYSGDSLYSLETSFILENQHSQNFILAPNEFNYFLYWNITDDNEVIDRSVSDTIFLKEVDTSNFNIALKTPQQIRLKGYLTPDTYRRLLFLRDSTIQKQIHLSIITINLKKVHLAYPTFEIIGRE